MKMIKVDVFLGNPVVKTMFNELEGKRLEPSIPYEKYKTIIESDYKVSDIHPEIYKNQRQFMVLGKEILPPKMELSDEIPVNKSVDSTLDFSLRDKLANTYNVSPLSYAAKIWNKPIFKITRRALGYTIGTKLVVSACLAAGPMGLLFGAFFAHSIYKYNKENRNSNSKSNVKSSGGNKKL